MKTKLQVIPFAELIRVDRAVQGHPGITIAQLAENVDLPEERVQTILDRLEARGRVRRRQHSKQFEPAVGGGA
jgi:DNA-binding IclR family transcriptional regulator